jgi:alkylation response protein AidB-like acyl-CoA dehydrogenase
MEFALNEEQRGWQMEARKFAEEEVAPISLERDAIADPFATFDWEIIRKGSKLGFRTLATPKKWGGHGADLVTQALVMTELARADSAISKTFSQNWKWSQLIAASCTEDQQERFLKPFVADDTYLLGSGNTEPNAGSDNRLPPKDDIKAGVQVRAERKGDEWVLNGEKCFIANGSVAKLFFVRTRTNPNVGVRDGSTLFLVPTSTPGFRIGKVFNKRGWRFYQNAELIFEDARVPHANLVGQLNGAAKARESDLSEFGDLELAANALGICDAAVEMAMQHARTARRAGRPLGEHQLTQLKLSEMHMLTEALRSFVLRAAWERDQAVAGDRGLRNSPNAGLVMNFSQPTVQRVTSLNMDIHGPEGALMNRGVDKLLRDAMIWTHLAGDSVQRMRSLRHLLH